MIETILSSLGRIVARQIAAKLDDNAAALEREFGWPDEWEPGTYGAAVLRYAESLRRLARSFRGSA